MAAGRSRFLGLELHPHLSQHREPSQLLRGPRTIGVTSLPSNSMERFIARVSSDAELIWKVIRFTSPSASLASSILYATVAGSPMKKAPRGPHVVSNCFREGADQPPSRPIAATTYAQPGKQQSMAPATAC